MELLMSVVVGVMVAGGIYLMLRARTFPVIIGLSLLSYAVNLMLFASGGLKAGTGPVIEYGRSEYPDPMPQALVLTAIVIGFAMTAFVLVLALRARYELGTDAVDGESAEQPE